MDWPDSLQHQVERDLNAFEPKRNRAWGIQIDFDVGTRNLDRYGGLLRRIRAALPIRYRLSVTGLMDWASQGKLEGLNALEGVVDEIVFQASQERRPIKEHRRYFERLSAGTLSVPFKLGLVEHGHYERDVLAAVRRPRPFEEQSFFCCPTGADRGVPRTSHGCTMPGSFTSGATSVGSHSHRNQIFHELPGTRVPRKLARIPPALPGIERQGL